MCTETMNKSHNNTFLIWNLNETDREPGGNSKSPNWQLKQKDKITSMFYNSVINNEKQTREGKKSDF